MPPVPVQVTDRGLIYNPDKNTWEEGWLTLFTRSKFVQFFTGQTIPVSGDRIYSQEYIHSPYSRVQVQAQLPSIAAGEAVMLGIQTSNDQSLWFDMRFITEGITEVYFANFYSNKNIAWQLPVTGAYIRMYAQLSSGITAKAITTYGNLIT